MPLNKDDDTSWQWSLPWKWFLPSCTQWRLWWQQYNRCHIWWWQGNSGNNDDRYDDHIPGHRCGAEIVAAMTNDMTIIFLATAAAHHKMAPKIPLLLKIILRNALLNAMSHPTMAAQMDFPILTPPTQQTPPYPTKIEIISPVAWLIRPIPGCKRAIDALSSIIAASSSESVPLTWSIIPLYRCERAITALSSILALPSLAAVSKKWLSFCGISVGAANVPHGRPICWYVSGHVIFVCPSPQNITDEKYQKRKLWKISILINVWN